jgi:hypothetical protein
MNIFLINELYQVYDDAVIHQYYDYENDHCYIANEPNIIRGSVTFIFPKVLKHIFSENEYILSLWDLFINESHLEVPEYTQIIPNILEPNITYTDETTITISYTAILV